jgi:hypothetical protein
MSTDDIWMGRPIAAMTRDELATALRTAARLLRSVRPASALRPEIELRQRAGGTSVARTFNWAFIPAGHLWSEGDRIALQSRLDAFAARHGLEGAVVHFGTDRLEVHIPRPLQVEQLMAIQEWLESERETLDVSQVP